MSGRHTVQTVNAAQHWKQRMADAKASLPKGVGQQDVIIEVVKLLPAIDSLIHRSRWHNAWMKRAADPEITVAVERAIQLLRERYTTNQ